MEPTTSFLSRFPSNSRQLWEPQSVPVSRVNLFFFFKYNSESITSHLKAVWLIKVVKSFISHLALCQTLTRVGVAVINLSLLFFNCPFLSICSTDGLNIEMNLIPGMWNDLEPNDISIPAAHTAALPINKEWMNTIPAQLHVRLQPVNSTSDYG